MPRLILHMQYTWLVLFTDLNSKRMARAHKTQHIVAHWYAAFFGDGIGFGEIVRFRLHSMFCVFVCLFVLLSTSTRCVVCTCVLHLHDVFSDCVSVATRCFQYFSTVPTNCVQWFVLCTCIMCSELVCFVPDECVQCSCFVLLHIVFSTSVVGIEALCEIQFRNLQRTFAPVRYVLHGGACNSIDVLSTARFFQDCPNHCVDTPVLDLVLNCAVWLRKEEAECRVNCATKWKT